MAVGLYHQDADVVAAAVLGLQGNGQRLLALAGTKHLASVASGRVSDLMIALDLDQRERFHEDGREVYARQTTRLLEINIDGAGA